MPAARQPARAPAAASATALPARPPPRKPPAPVSSAAALQRRIGNGGMRQLAQGQRAGPAVSRGAARAPDREAGAGKAAAARSGRADGFEAAAAGADAPAVRLHMPPPPSRPSPATMHRIEKVNERADDKVAAHGDLPDGEKQVAAAQEAVTPPVEQAEAQALAALIATVKGAPSPRIVELCEHIRDDIEKQRPDEDELMEAKPEVAAEAAGKELNATVTEETGKVTDNYATLNANVPIAQPPNKPGIASQPPVVPTAPINPRAATPDAVPEAKVSLDEDAAEARKKTQDAGMDSPAAQLVQSGPVAEARAARGELDQVAREGPAEALAKQKLALAGAEAGMASLGSRALAALTASRKETVTSNEGRQHGMVRSEERKRADAGDEAKRIFTGAQDTVQALIGDLPATAMKEWNAAKDGLVLKFKADLAKVQAFIDESHSGFGGGVNEALDSFFGMPLWVTLDYIKAEREFGDGVIKSLKAISAKVDALIKICDLIIEGARRRIDQIYLDLGPSLQVWAAQEREKFNAQLDTLHNQVAAARDGFEKDLMQEAKAVVHEVRTEIAALRKKASGLIGRIVAAVGRFLDDPVKFIIDGLLELLGISPAAFWAVVAKIKKYVSAIADDPLGFGDNLMSGMSQGFSQFFDNFGEHMARGFLTWLFGDLKGVQLPKDLSLKSVVTFFLQLMGITWPNIHKILVKKIGAQNVALITKAWSLVSLLIEKGPEGIFEMIKEKLDPQSIVDQVIEMAVEYMVTAIVKQVAVRLLLLFNPVGAILQALEAIYKVLKWIFQNAAKIFTLIETVVNGIGDIIAGNLPGFAKAVENALEALIAPVIAFIADYFSLGDLPKVVADKIKSMQQWVLGLIEDAIGWIIEKGKALLATVGIGKKDEKGKGGGDDQVGETVQFEADGESHQLWVDTKGGAATLMVASDTKSLLAYLDEAAKNADIKGTVAQAKALAGKADINADFIAKTIVHVKSKNDETGVSKDLSEKKKNLTDEEKQLAALLVIIFTAMKPIKSLIGSPVADVKKAPYGYALFHDRGSYEYGGAPYDYIEIKRDDGFGSANQTMFPRVNAKGGVVNEGAALYQADYPVIERYKAAIDSIRDKLEGDEAPDFTQSPDSPRTALEAGANKMRNLNMGTRKQMEATIAMIEHAAKTGEYEVTGIELVTGKKRVDLSLRRKAAAPALEAMVEYKHWTGHMSLAKRNEMTAKLEDQLRGQIEGGRKGFAVLILMWPAFNTLDDASRDAFRGVFGRVAFFGLGKGVSLQLLVGGG